MKIETGTTRKVLIFRHFVFKFPIFNKPDWKAVAFLLKVGIHKHILRDKKFEANFLKEFNFFECLATSLTPLTDGISSNFLEFYLFVTTRNVFLVPTYFSLFGFINVQRRIDKIRINRDSQRVYPFGELFPIIDKYYRDAPSQVVVPFCHHMLKESYAWDKFGHLCMFDYGNKSVFLFIREKGKEVYDKFSEQR